MFECRLQAQQLQRLRRKLDEIVTSGYSARIWAVPQRAYLNGIQKSPSRVSWAQHAER